MATSLADYVEWLKRLVATPGDFDSFYPNTSDDDLAFTLMDAFSEAQMDGFFLQPTLFAGDSNALTVTPELSRPQLSLVLLYASVQFMRAELLNKNNRVRYVAKGLEYETEQSASVITALLKEANDRKQAVLTLQQTAQGATSFFMADAYVIRAVGIARTSDVDLAVSQGILPFADPFVV